MWLLPSYAGCAASRVFHPKLYGDVVSGCPYSAPSTYNSTLLTESPLATVAEALTFTVPTRPRALFAGEVIDVLGAV